MDNVGIALGTEYNPEDIRDINAFQLMVHETKDLSTKWTPDRIAELRRLKGKHVKLFCHSVFKVVIGRPYSTVIFRDHYIYVCKQRFEGYVVHLPVEMDPYVCIEEIKKMINSAARILEDRRIQPITVYFEHVPSGYFTKKFAQFAKLLKGAQLRLPIGICVDTCHLYVSGISLDSAESVDHYFAKLRNLGLPILIHLNDSVGDYNSLIDRHAELGTKIWEHEKSGLAELLKLPYIKIIELGDCRASVARLSDIIRDTL
jgi:endonuclease IV